MLKKITAVIDMSAYLPRIICSNECEGKESIIFQVIESVCVAHRYEAVDIMCLLQKSE